MRKAGKFHWVFTCTWGPSQENENLKKWLVVVQSLSPVQLFVTRWTAAHQASLSFTISQSCSNSRPLNQWCHLTISSSVVPSFSCRRSFPASASSPVSRLFSSGGQSIGASVSASILLMNIQNWFPLGLTGLFSLQKPPWKSVAHSLFSLSLSETVHAFSACIISPSKLFPCLTTLCLLAEFFL